jgi:hypothetical protein
VRVRGEGHCGDSEVVKHSHWRCSRGELLKVNVEQRGEARQRALMHGDNRGELKGHRYAFGEL